MNKTQNLISWIFQIVAAVIMLQTLYFKFGAHPDSIKLFTQLGMEPTGRIGTGVAELIASLLILYPRTSWLGALMGVGLMLGAIYFHLAVLGISFNGDGGALFTMAVIVLVSSLVVLFIHRKQIPFINTLVA